MVLRILFLLILLIAAIWLIAYQFQHKYIFLPTRLADNTRFQFDGNFEEISLSLNNAEDKLSGIYFKAADTSSFLVLYFHGNADNLQRWGNFAKDFTRLGFDFFAIDYPGYGKSPGTPSEEGIYESALAAWEWAEERYPPEKIIIYGRSMGSAPASYIASKKRARQLFLETPFFSMEQLLEEHAPIVFRLASPKYRFPVHQFIAESELPVFIFQGTNDRLVPLSNAEKLKPLLKSGDEFIIIEGGKHKNLNTFEAYHKNLERLLTQP